MYISLLGIHLWMCKSFIFILKISIVWLAQLIVMKHGFIPVLYMYVQQIILIIKDTPPS